MKIKDTELEYHEADSVALDYYLGESCETKDQWAKRVWGNCKEYADTNGMGYNPTGKKMPSVYAQDAKDLWANKKKRRRAALVKHFIGMPTDESEFKRKRIPGHLNHDAMKFCKNHKDYKTRDERDALEAQKQQERDLKVSEEIKSKTQRLKKSGMTDEQIEILFPAGIKFLKETINRRPKVGMV
jgi:hypothetical protein